MLSIITPVLNGENFINENIKSIAKLDIDYEHIIVDGGSTDKTLEIIQRYPNIKVLHQTEKTGMYGAIDIGFKKAVGDYICWINCDDRIISANYNFFYHFAQSENYDFVCSDGLIIDSKSNKNIKVRGTRFVKFFLNKGIFPFLQPSTMYSKNLYLAVNGLDYMRYRIIGDMDLFYRMSLLPESKFGYFSADTSIFMKYGNSLGDNNGERARYERESNKILPVSPKYLRALLRLARIFHL